MFIQTRKSLKDKRAVSELIGYILLITFAIVIAGVVFQWLKTYVPKEGIACPDEVSIYISDYTFDKNSKELNLILKNNGQFSIGGIFIYYSTDETQEIAVNDLSKEVKDKNKFLNLGIALGVPGENSFKPGEEKSIIFDIADLKDTKNSAVEKIYAVEIIPLRWQAEGTKKSAPVSCANAKTKKILNLKISKILLPDLGIA